MKKNILIYLCFFVLFVITSILIVPDMDVIWSYGFSYNISQGLIPYKDFNMVIGPLYNIIFSIPMIFFGNYLFLFEIEHIILFSLLFTFLYKKIGIRTFFLLIIYAISFAYLSYNLFCTTLFMFILLLLDTNFKYKQLLIGIMIGMILMTKHNIGLFLLIPYIYDNRKSLLNLLSLLIPIVPTLLYLLINNVLYSYIDFAYFGIGSFMSNLLLHKLSILLYVLLIIPFIVCCIKKMNIKLFYILAFQIVIFPIFDINHIMLAQIPIIYYLILIYNKSRFLGYIISVVYLLIYAFSFPSINIEFNDDYLKYQNVSCIPFLENYSNYIDKLDDGDIYLFTYSAYAIKLYRNENPSFYDLINRGNLGSNDNKYIEMIKDNCKDKKCYFILHSHLFRKNDKGQMNQIFKNYVLDNCNYVETLFSDDRLYTNKEVE